MICIHNLLLRVSQFNHVKLYTKQRAPLETKSNIPETDVDITRHEKSWFYIPSIIIQKSLRDVQWSVFRDLGLNRLSSVPEALLFDLPQLRSLFVHSLFWNVKVQIRGLELIR